MAVKFRGSSLIADGSYNINNSIQIPQIPKRRIFFENSETGKVFNVTDLYLKKKKRESKLTLFKETYIRDIKNKLVSVFLIIANSEYYTNPSEFIERFAIKLKRKKVKILAYYWQSDVGDIEFEHHFHFIVVVKRLSGDDVKAIFKTKNSNCYKFQLCNSINGFKNYLKKKEIYALKGKRSYGTSKEFKKV
jgi:hypothetical protein